MGSVEVVNYKDKNKNATERKASTLTNLTNLLLNENQKGQSTR